MKRIKKQFKKKKQEKKNKQKTRSTCACVQVFHLHVIIDIR